MAKVVLLNSGGLDSALVAKWLVEVAGHEVHSLFIDTRQVNRVPTSNAAKITAQKFCNSHKEIMIDFGQISNYWENFEEGTVEMYQTIENPQEEYYSRPFQQFHVCPNLSMLFSSIGVAYAKTIGCGEVYSGHRVVLGESYIQDYNQIVNESRHEGVSRPELMIPFFDVPTYQQLSGDILADCVDHVCKCPPGKKYTCIKREFAYTHSCRLAEPCGICEKCTARHEMGLP